MQIDLDIENMLADAVRNALSPEKMQPIIEANVSKAVRSAIEEQFRYSSPFDKLLKDSVSAVMPTSLEDMGRLGDLVLKTVMATVNETQVDFVQRAVEAKMKSMLQALPAKMTLSALVGMLVKEFDEPDNYERKECSRPSIIVKKADYPVSGYWSLAFDPEEGKGEYSCRVRAAFTQEGRCYSLHIQGEDVKKALLISTTYSADALMLQLYIGGVEVELDKEDFEDVEYSSGNFD